ncbi:MAG: hypothetical protein WCQ72_00855 [Eubacteriales bacterium]
MTQNDRVADFIRRRAAEFADDIAICALYGSYVNGTSNRLSDVDCFFIPKTRRGNDFAADFIIGGIGYDIYPITWERLEAIASLRDRMLPCLCDSVIIYASCAADRERFLDLRCDAQRALASRDVREAAARARFDFARSILAALPCVKNVSELYSAAAALVCECADCAAVYTGNYFRYGTKRQYAELHTIPVPAALTALYHDILLSSDVNVLPALCRDIFRVTADFIGADASVPPASGLNTDSGSSKTPDYNGMARFYEEVSSTFNKVYISAESGDVMLCILSAASLCYELDELSRENGVVLPSLLERWNPCDTAPAIEDIKNAEKVLVSVIESGGGVIHRYADMDEFERAMRI